MQHRQRHLHTSACQYRKVPGTLHAECGERIPAPGWVQQLSNGADYCTLRSMRRNIWPLIA